MQEALAQLTWYHNLALIEKLNDLQTRLWYAKSAVENGWSRNVLVHQIETKLYERQGKAITNFDRALPKPQSDLAIQIIKDPYNFEDLDVYKSTGHEIGLSPRCNSPTDKRSRGADYYLWVRFYFRGLLCRFYSKANNGTHEKDKSSEDNDSCSSSRCRP